MAIVGSPVGEAAAEHSGSVGSEEVVEVMTHSTADTEQGTAAVDISYHVGDSILGLEVDIVDDVTVVETDGFTETSDGTYEWDERTSEPTISVVRDINQSSERFQGLDFADAGDWVLTDAVETQPRFRVSSGTDVERRVVAKSGDSDGVVGGRWVYVGDAQQTDFDAEGQQITLVVSDAAALPGSVDDIRNRIAQSSSMLDVAGRSDELTLFVVTDPLRAGGLTTSAGTDVWVNNGSIEPPRTTLWHEYAHARQDYRPESGVQWTYEGSAEYYGFLLGMKQGDLEYHRFHDHFADADDEYDSVILSNPDTWQGTRADYELGGLAVAALDSEIRDASGGQTTFQDAFRAVNTHDERVTEEDLESFVSDAAGTDVAPFFDEHVHSETDSLDVPAPTTYDASNDGANPRLDVSDTVVEPGENGNMRVTITNDGDETSLAPYLTVDTPATFETSGLRVDSQPGIASDVTRVDDGWAIDHLEPGETVTVEYEFTAAPETPHEAHEVGVAVTDMSGQGDASTAAVEAGEVPTAELDTVAGVPVGEETTFDASASSDDAVSYRWTIAGPRDDSTETGGLTLDYTFEEPGEYDVGLAVENEQGLTATTNATVVASDQPTVEIDGPEQVDPGEPVTFEAIVTNEYGATDISWDVFDQTADGPTVEVTFQEVGERTVNVTVTDEYGATGTASTTVAVGDAEADDGTEDSAADGAGDGFGVTAAVLALSAVLVASRIRRP